MREHRSTSRMRKNRLTCRMRAHRSTCRLREHRFICRLREQRSSSDMSKYRSTCKMREHRSICITRTHKPTCRMREHRSTCKMREHRDLDLDCVFGPHDLNACGIDVRVNIRLRIWGHRSISLMYLSQWIRTSLICPLIYTLNSKRNVAFRGKGVKHLCLRISLNTVNKKTGWNVHCRITPIYPWITLVLVSNRKSTVWFTGLFVKPGSKDNDFLNVSQCWLTRNYKDGQRKQTLPSNGKRKP